VGWVNHENSSKSVYVLYGKNAMENFIDRATGRFGEKDFMNASRSSVKEWATLNYGPSSKIRWDRRCGCSCGCSPGFRLQSHSMIKEPRNTRAER